MPGRRAVGGALAGGIALGSLWARGKLHPPPYRGPLPLGLFSADGRGTGCSSRRTASSTGADQRRAPGVLDAAAGRGAGGGAMSIRYALCALLLAFFALQLRPVSLEAQPKPDHFGVVELALDHVKLHLPEGRIGLHLDYIIGEGVPGSDEIRWVRPYNLIDPALQPVALDALESVSAVKGELQVVRLR